MMNTHGENRTRITLSHWRLRYKDVSYAAGLLAIKDAVQSLDYRALPDRMISELVGKSVAQSEVLEELKKTCYRRSPVRCVKVEPTE